MVNARPTRPLSVRRFYYRKFISDIVFWKRSLYKLMAQPELFSAERNGLSRGMGWQCVECRAVKLCDDVGSPWLISINELERWLSQIVDLLVPETPLYWIILVLAFSAQGSGAISGERFSFPLASFFRVLTSLSQYNLTYLLEYKNGANLASYKQ